ncbi:MAG: flagellar hook-associated protein FlgL [Chromatiales bacterium]|nr:flagellar hook-associated protein FlgL [Chromatiales bacterium]
MRVSTKTMQQQPVKAMLEQQEVLSKVQKQLALGKSILQPSDDPSGTARANQLRDAMGRSNQYMVNGDTAEDRLTQEESIFGSMVNSMQRARQLAVQSLNDSYNAQDRMGIGEEIEQFFQEFMGLVNTQSASGEYLFSGFQGDTKPFSDTYSIKSTLTTQEHVGNAVATTSAPIGANGVIADVLQFSGDVGTKITVTDNEEASSIATKINADTALAAAGITATASNSVTMTIPNNAQTYASGYTFSINGNPIAVQDFTGGANLTTVAAAIQAADATLNAVVRGSDIVITNATGNDIRIEDVTDGLASNTDSIMAVNGIALDELGAKTSNDSISIGGTVAINSGGSVDYKVVSTHSKNVMRSSLTQSKDLVLDYHGDSGQRDIRIGDSVKIQMNDPGDELFVNLPSAENPDKNKSLFNVLYDFMSELKSGVRPSDDVLTDIDTAMSQIETTRAKVGSRLNMIDRQRMVNEDYSIFAQQSVSKIEDLDMAEAISILNQQLLSMQVLQQTYTRVSSLSMFNYL